MTKQDIISSQQALIKQMAQDIERLTTELNEMQRRYERLNYHIWESEESVSYQVGEMEDDNAEAYNAD